jgi:hypothetical protein
LLTMILRLSPRLFVNVTVPPPAEPLVIFGRPLLLNRNFDSTPNTAEVMSMPACIWPVLIVLSVPFCTKSFALPPPSPLSAHKT